MAFVNFVIPHGKQELFDETPEQYYVRDVISPKELHKKLKGKIQLVFDDFIYKLQ